jgi:uncharacterized lipoprotein YddW (UPF0748 family)
MKEGWIDYVVPQDYFDLDYWKVSPDNIEYELVKYADLAKWWAEISKETNCKLYMGQGIYRYTDKGNWSNPEEIINQVKYNMNYNNIAGVIFFTYKNLVENHVPALVEARKMLTELWTKPAKEI